MDCELFPLTAASYSLREQMNLNILNKQTNNRTLVGKHNKIQAKNWSVFLSMFLRALKLMLSEVLIPSLN